MKKDYTAPTFELLTLNPVDVVAASGGRTERVGNDLPIYWNDLDISI